MNKRSALLISIMAAVAMMAAGLMLPISHSTAQSSKQLVGTWILVSADSFGSSPKGSLMFDSEGRFSAIFLRGDLPNYASNKRTQGTADEYKATVNGAVAVFGTYTVSGTDLNLHIEGSTFPNWIGTDQKRRDVVINGAELRYTQPTPSAGGPPAVIVWKRASAGAGTS